MVGGTLVPPPLFDECAPLTLGPGSVSADQDTVTLLYGDEGPGSNPIRDTVRR
jgi:hypothetical protein